MHNDVDKTCIKSCIRPLNIRRVRRVVSAVTSGGCTSERFVCCIRFSICVRFHIDVRFYIDVRSFIGIRLSTGVRSSTGVVETTCVLYLIT
jgi:hypothetical protein